MNKPTDLSVFVVPGIPESQKTPPLRLTDRQGRSTMVKGFRISVEASEQLAFLALECRKKQQHLLIEALNMLFEKYGKPPIA